MTLTRRIARLGSLGSLVGGLLAHHPAAAGQVAIFDRTVPQAAELAKILWPQATPDGRQYGRTRSIRLSAEPAPQAPAMAGPVVALAPAPEPGPPQAQAASAQRLPVRKPAAPTRSASRSASRSTRPSCCPSSRPYLDSVGEMLRLPRAQGKRVLIVGHTDALGGEVYNQVLSERRAAAVRAYLADRFGIPAELLLVEGEGKHEPLPGLDPRAPQNRRVEFHAAG